MSALLLGFPSLSQAIGATLDRLTPQYGLSQNTVTSMLLDSDGFLWIGTENGLNRFDGYQTLVVSDDSGIVANAYVNSLVEDGRGRLLVSTDDGLFILDRPSGQWQRVFNQPEKPPVLASNAVAHSLPLANGDLLVSTWRGIDHLNPQGEPLGRFERPEWQQPVEGVRQLLQVDQHFWAASTTGLYRFAPNDNQLERIAQPSLNSNKRLHNIRQMLKSSDNLIWLATRGGVVKAHRDHASSEWQFAAVAGVNVSSFSLFEDGEGLWVGTAVGLYLVRGDGTEAEKILTLTNSNLANANDRIYAIQKGQHGYLWLGTDGDGIYSWQSSSRRFVTFTSRNSPLQTDVIWSLYEQPGVGLWIGTGSGVYLKPEKGGEWRSFFTVADPDQPFANNVYSMQPINEQQLLIATPTGIGLLNWVDNHFEWMTDYQRGVQPSVHSLLKVNDSVWAATESGIYTLDLKPKSGQWQWRHLSEGLGGQFPYQDYLVFLLKDSYGDVWIGSENAVYRWAANGSKPAQKIHSVPEERVSNSISPSVIYRQDRDTVWVGYSGAGFHQLDLSQRRPQMLASFDQRHGFHNDIVYSLLPDNQQHLWLSTHAGLVRFNLDTHTHAVFDLYDGLPTNEFNEAAWLQASNGDIWLGSMRGLVRFRPQELNRPEHTPLVAITRLGSLSQSLELDVDNVGLGDLAGTQVVLPYQNPSISIRFSALDYKRPGKTLYRYWLDGGDSRQVIETRSPHATFANLAAGDYAFYVVAVDSDTKIESPAAKIALRVEAAPWVSSWAVIAYLAVAGALLSWALWYRHQRRRQFTRQHQRLQESEERLKMALWGSGNGVWEWDARNNTIYEASFDELSPRVSRLTHISFEEHLSKIHPDDQTGYLKKWHAFLDKHTESFECIYRMSTENGEVRWFCDRGRVVKRSSAGRPAKVTGTYADVTLAQENEAKVRLFSEAFENTSDAVFILDANGYITAVNKAFQHITGLNAESLIGKYLDVLRSKRLSEDFFEHIVSQVKKRGFWEGEAWSDRVHGESFPILVKINSIRDNEQNITHFVVVFSDISNQKQSEQKLRRLANYDSLTHLPNRALLSDRLQHAIERAHRTGTPMGVMFIDLDRFKQVNDSLGHDAGDLLLIKVANVLKETLREDDTIARISGDEFVAVFENLKSTTNLTRIAQKILNQLAQPFLISRRKVTVTPSIGISLFPDDGTDAKTLLKHADTAMYHAKQSGRNNFQFFTQQMNAQALQRLTLEAEFRDSVHKQELYLEFQPRVDLITSDVVGFEALLRWRRRDGQLVSPDVFIPIAEELGLIFPVTEWVMDQVGKLLSQWSGRGRALPISVNLSARHFQHYDLVQTTRSFLQKYNVPAQWLEYEITESSLMDNMENSLRILKKLSELGIQLSLDDFGTGYSSLSYLRQFPVHTLKIDKTFIHDIGKDNSGEALVESIVRLADKLNLQVVAEGIETPAQLNFLRERHCQYGQGFLLHRPMSGKKMLSLSSSLLVFED